MLQSFNLQPDVRAAVTTGVAGLMRECRPLREVPEVHQEVGVEGQTPLLRIHLHQDQCGSLQVAEGGRY